jgi:hypothetical protein
MLQLISFVFPMIIGLSPLINSFNYQRTYRWQHFYTWYIQDFVPQYYNFSALTFIKLRVGKYNYKWRKLSKCVQDRLYNYTCKNTLHCWCLLGYICSCFLHTLNRLVRGYKLSWFCTLPRKSRRFIARKKVGLQ